jgi:hypothetical protein
MHPNAFELVRSERALTNPLTSIEKKGFDFFFRSISPSLMIDVNYFLLKY